MVDKLVFLIFLVNSNTWGLGEVAEDRERAHDQNWREDNMDASWKKKVNPKGESERWAGTSPGTPGTEQRKVKLHVCKEDSVLQAGESMSRGWKWMFGVSKS